MTSISMVIPAYNEESNVARTLEAVSEVAERLEMEYEIIAVNDGSADSTGSIIREMQQQIPNLRLEEHYPNWGYGGALRAGFDAATKELIAYVPADGQFDFREVDSFLEKVSSADIVCGYRASRRDNLLRRLNGWGWNSVVRLLFGYLCRDIDCGFKLFRRDVVEQLNLTSNGAMIDTEMLATARACGFRIAEVPVTHLPRQAGEATGANPLVIARAFRDLLGFRLRLSQRRSNAPRRLPRLLPVAAALALVTALVVARMDSSQR